MLNIYKASAGSGKTYRLAKDYIKLLLGYKLGDGSGRMQLKRGFRNAHRRILAITFTNKATEEMKRRILHELARLGGCEPGWDANSPYLKDLTEELECSPEELKAAAAAALTDLVSDYSFFNISTIDSFFQQVLRTFAREAQVMGDYDVNINDTEVLTMAVGNMLAELNHPAPDKESENANARLTDWLLEYLKSLHDSGKAINLFNRDASLRSKFVNFILRISDEEFTGHYDELMAYLRNPDRPIEKFRDALLESVAALGELRRHEGAEAAEVPDASALWVKLMNKFADGSATDTQLGSATFAKALLSPEKLIKKGGSPAAAERINRAALKIKELSGKIFLAEAALDTLYVLGVVGKVYACIDDIHRDSNTIQLSDTNSLLREIIGDETDAPFIYERMGTYLDHYLIDEFQDTSLLQWENLRPLIAESHARDNDNLIIGDEKQCIYRFRNSDPSLLKDKVERDFTDRVELTGLTKADNTNWRSSAEVVQFNNALFRTITASDSELKSIYANVEQNVSPKHKEHRGFVEVRAIEASKSDDYDRLALDIMMEGIKTQLCNGYKPSDIAVLTRKTEEAAAVISRLMEEAATMPPHLHYKVISDDAMRVDSSPVVRSIITHLRFLGAKDVKSRERAMTPKKFSRLINAYEQECSRFPAADYPPETVAERMGDILKGVVSILHRDDAEVPLPGAEADTAMASDLSVIVERILDSIPEKMRSEQAMYVTAFMDLLADYIDSGPNDIRSFLAWWDSFGSRGRVSSPQTDDAIRVMTIHKAKGLEFPCVHIPFGSWKTSPRSDSVKWFVGLQFDGVEPSIVPPVIPLTITKKLNFTAHVEAVEQFKRDTLLDELNVLYVALTRAVDQLSVSLRVNPSAKSGSETLAPNTTGGLILGALQRILKSENPEVNPGIREEADSLSSVVDEVTGLSAPEGNSVTAFRLGEPTRPREEEAKPLKALDVMSSATMPEYYILDRSDLWNNTTVELPEHFDNPRTRGILLHAALAGIRRVSDVDRSLRRMVATGLLPRAKESEFRAILHREIARPEARQWFENCKRVLSERSFYTADNPETGEAVTGRPDRIVWTDSGTIDIVDYKTGELPADEEARNKILQKYSAQVRRYARILRKSLPDDCAPIRGFIWHLDASEIIPVKIS